MHPWNCFGLIIFCKGYCHSKIIFPMKSFFFSRVLLVCWMRNAGVPVSTPNAFPFSKPLMKSHGSNKAISKFVFMIKTWHQWNFIMAASINTVLWKTEAQSSAVWLPAQPSNNQTVIIQECGDRIVRHRVLAGRGSIAPGLKARFEKCLKLLVKWSPSSSC